MKKTSALLIAALAAIPAVAGAADEPPAQASSLLDAITDGKLLLYLRPRYEYVDQANKPENANAYTMRTLFGWRTKPFHGLSVTAEGINVSHLGNQEFNDNPANRTSPYPTVADPDTTSINQLYVEYLGLPQTDARVGWQSIKLDNLRFLGNVDFRQVMQVFDAAWVENKSIDKLTIQAGYLWRQRNILNQQYRMEMPAFNARYAWQPGNEVVGYAYLQNQDYTGQNTGFSDNSNKIFGLRANGGYPIGERFKLLYTGEYAKQDSYADGNDAIDAHYVHVGAGPQYGDWFVRIDYELLSSNDGRYGFQTPLATLHVFQGWADQFTTTPKQGIQDTYVAAGGKLFGVSLYTELHKFESDSGSIDFGHELDIGLTYPMPFLKGLTGKLEYADYTAGDAVPGDALANKVDVRKFWATLIYQF